jgi:hypothetical protein
VSDFLELLRDVLTASAFWAGVVSVVSAYLVYRAGVKNGERQLEADKQRDEATTAREAQQLHHEATVLSVNAKRDAYSDLLHSIWEVLAWITVEDEFSGQVGPPRPAPPDMRTRLARAAALATIHAGTPAVAQEIASLHGELVTAAAMHVGIGRGSLPGLTATVEAALPGLRAHLRDDLDRA